MKKKTWFVSLFVLFVTVFGVVIVEAQGPRPGTRAPSALPGTGFTYQGQLKKSGALVNDTCDFSFSLYDAESTGTQIGSTDTVNSVSVANGLFTAVVNSTGVFGANAFNGDARWLRINVRCPAGGVGLYTNLSPRQPLTPAPLAFALPGLYTQQNVTSPNIIGGYNGNSVTSGVLGATISGGGASGLTNRVTDNYGTVGGGRDNQAGDGAGSTSNILYATVGGGNTNTASGHGSTVSGGKSNTASSSDATVGGGNSNTANYQSATVGGGQSNAASYQFATVGGGDSNTASNSYATVPGGYRAKASHFGEMAYASGSFAADGDAQTSVYVLRNTTTDQNWTELFLDGSSLRITLANNRTMTFDILITGRSSTGSSIGYQIYCVIKNVGGTTSLVSAIVTDLGSDYYWLSLHAGVTASDTYDALSIWVYGTASTTIRWVATVRTVEVWY